MSTAIFNFIAQYSLYNNCIVHSFGIVGNVLNILIFTQLKLFQNNRSSFYLTFEAISNFFNDLLIIASSVIVEIYGNDGTEYFLIWCKVKQPGIQIFALITSSMVCCASVDQFFSTNHRHDLRQMCTLKLARCLTFTFICLWVMHNTIYALFLDIVPSFGCIITNPIYLQYASFFFYAVLLGMLPIIIASFFSLLAFRNVRRIVRRQIPIERRRLDRQMTAMVLIRVIIFVCLSLPYVSFRIYAINSPVSRNQPMDFATRQLIQTVLTSISGLNFVVSFYAFMLSSSRFRRQVKYFLMKKCWKRWIQWCCCTENEIAPETQEQLRSTLELEVSN